MKISVLCENTSLGNGLINEHGLSIYIEALGKRILFDTGQSDAFARNAELMGVDLRMVDLAVLSHGHYDHAGGLGRFFELNEKAPLYVRREAFGEYYNGVEKYIGVNGDFFPEGRTVILDGSVEICGGIRILTRDGLVPKVKINPWGLKKKVGAAMEDDDFAHEQYLLVEEDGRRILFSGCSHCGILNILDWFEPHILVGGFHFTKLSPSVPEDAELLRSSAEAMMKHDTVFYTAHCTGEEQFEFLKKIMGERVDYLRCGKELQI